VTLTLKCLWTRKDFYCKR